MSGRGHIRSYVLRQGRFSAAQRAALERLAHAYVLSADSVRISLEEIFPECRRFVLEIGFGMGEATADLAERMSGTGFLGVEVHGPGIGRLLMEIERRRLANVRIVHADAVLVVRDMIGEGSLDGVHVFFPDPWPKKRHHKRRLLQGSFLEILAARLRPGGYLYCVTDWEPYARQILEAAADSRSLMVLPPEAPPPVHRSESGFERKGRRAGRGVHELVFVRAGACQDCIKM